MRKLKASVAIPTLNGGLEFEKCLEMMYRQKTTYPFEVIVIDSGSNDGTVEIARKFPLRLYHINKKDFNHGLTRQWGVELAEGDYVAFLSQDAIPADENWLESLVEHFEDDKVAGVYSRQLVKPDCDLIARKYAERWISSSEYKRVSYIKSRDEYDALSPWSKRLFVNFDNVSSCVRKSLMREFPFLKKDFGEDLDWGRRVIEAGYKIVFEPKSKVYHSHGTSIVGNYERYVMDNKAMKELFGVDFFAQIFMASKLVLLRSTLHAIYEDFIAIKNSDLKLVKKLKWMLTAIPAEVILNYTKLKGAASASTKVMHQGNLKIVQVAHAFLPCSYGGTETYTYNLTKTLSEKNEVYIFYSKADKTATEYQVASGFYNGLPTVSINNNIHGKPDHLMIYENRSVDKAFENFLKYLKPDVIHFQHLHGLSIGMIGVAKRLRIPTVLTLADYWFICPRGQMLDYKWELCSQVIDEKCARCVFEPQEHLIALEKRHKDSKFIDLIGTLTNTLLAEAYVKAPNPDFVQTNVFEIEGTSKYVLSEHPPSEVRYRLRLPRRCHLEFSLAMHPSTWEESGEGVVFEICVEHNGFKDRIFSHYIDPKHNIQDRKWHDFTLDISEFGRNTVDLIFLTSPGPQGNIAFCDAGWGNLKIIVEQADDEDWGVLRLVRRRNVLDKLLSQVRNIIAKSKRDPKILVEGLRRAFLRPYGEKARLKQIKKRKKDILRALDNIDVIIAPSKFLSGKYLDSDIPTKKMIFSDYGMNSNTFALSPKNSTNRLVFGFTGSLIPSKGIHILVDAFVRVPEDKAELRIYGRISQHYPDYYNMLKRLAGQKMNIKFLGEYYLDEAPKIYSRLNLLVVPSIWHENSPLTIHEAFMAGVPVIASNIGGMAELVINNINGLLFRVGDPEDLYKTIMKVIENTELISQLRANIPRVKSVEENAEELQELYKTLIAQI